MSNLKSIFVIPLIILMFSSKVRAQENPPLTFFIVNVSNEKCGYNSSISHKIMAFQGKINYPKVKKVKEGLTKLHSKNGSNVNVLRYSLYKEDDIYVLYETTFNYNGCQFKSIDGFVAKDSDNIEKMIKNEISSKTKNSLFQYVSHSILEKEKYELHDADWISKMKGAIKQFIEDYPIENKENKKDNEKSKSTGIGVRG